MCDDKLLIRRRLFCRALQGIRLGLLSAAVENQVSLVNLVLLRDAEAFIGQLFRAPQLLTARHLAARPFQFC
eukprot:1764843-Rhodomonas_salina.3